MEELRPKMQENVDEIFKLVLREEVLCLDPAKGRGGEPGGEEKSSTTMV